MGALRGGKGRKKNKVPAYKQAMQMSAAAAEARDSQVRQKAVRAKVEAPKNDKQEDETNDAAAQEVIMRSSWCGRDAENVPIYASHAILSNA
jgi:hypothetical protein